MTKAEPENVPKIKTPSPGRSFGTADRSPEGRGDHGGEAERSTFTIQHSTPTRKITFGHLGLKTSNFELRISNFEFSLGVLVSWWLSKRGEVGGTIVSWCLSVLVVIEGAEVGGTIVFLVSLVVIKGAEAGTISPRVRHCRRSPVGRRGSRSRSWSSPGSSSGPWYLDRGRARRCRCPGNQPAPAASSQVNRNTPG